MLTCKHSAPRSTHQLLCLQRQWLNLESSACSENRSIQQVIHARWKPSTRVLWYGVTVMHDTETLLLWFYFARFIVLYILFPLNWYEYQTVLLARGCMWSMEVVGIHFRPSHRTYCNRVLCWLHINSSNLFHIWNTPRSREWPSFVLIACVKTVNGNHCYFTITCPNLCDWSFAL